MVDGLEFDRRLEQRKSEVGSIGDYLRMGDFYELLGGEFPWVPHDSQQCEVCGKYGHPKLVHDPGFVNPKRPFPKQE